MCFTHLADAHIDAAIVLADVEVEVLVVDLHVTTLRQIALEPVGNQVEFHSSVFTRDGVTG